MKDQKVAIVNALSVITTPKMSEPITDFLIENSLVDTTAEKLTAIEGVTPNAAEKVMAVIEIHNIFVRATAKNRSTTPKPTAVDKFKVDNSLEDRVEIGRKVAELRINAEGSKPLAWRVIRGRLNLRNDEFHKVVRLEDHFKESCVTRIESFKDGWEYNGKLDVLLGFIPEGTLLERIEACKPESSKKVKESKEVKDETSKEPEPKKVPKETLEETKPVEKPKQEEAPEVYREDEEIPEPTEAELEAMAIQEVMDSEQAIK